ncbi:hypothetical protein J6590_096739 [Homalodisca vitripennis]|nr:hypothetical protein J6590_096739 [Homalodisca vitripennis]
MTVDGYDGRNDMTVEQSDRLQRTQNYCIRCIFNLRCHEHACRLCNALTYDIRCIAARFGAVVRGLLLESCRGDGWCCLLRSCGQSRSYFKLGNRVAFECDYFCDNLALVRRRVFNLLTSETHSVRDSKAKQDKRTLDAIIRMRKHYRTVSADVTPLLPPYLSSAPEKNPMCHLNLSNLVDVQERHITNRNCRDSGLHGKFNRSCLLWEMTVGVGGVCFLTPEVLASLNKGVPPPAYFDWRRWFRRPNSSSWISIGGGPYSLNLTHPEYLVTSEAAQRFLQD